MDSQLTLLVLYLYSILHCVEGKADPCKDNHLLPQLGKRLVGYTLLADEKPFCDHYLPDGWYSMDTYVLASKASSCGTTVGWYMKGKLPTGGQANVHVCKNDGTDCTVSHMVQVQECGGKYVFNLKHLDGGCPEGICVEPLPGTKLHVLPAPDFSAVHPDVNVELDYVKKSAHKEVGVLRFYCDFTPTVKMTGYFYKVEWSLTSGLSLTKTLRLSMDIQYKSKHQFRRDTVLEEETHLKDQLLHKAGFTIVCSLSAKASAGGKYSHAVTSNHKFVGIQVENADGEIHIRDKESHTIQLRLTVPFGCPKQHGKEVDCPLDVNVFIPDDTSKKCEIPNLSQLKAEANTCGVEFYNSDINKPKNFTITTRDGYTLTHGFGRGYEVALQTIDFTTHDMFSRYTLTPVRVALLSNTKPILNGKVCSAHSDPHMVSFDGQPFECQEKGTFILYRNTKYRVEAQMRTSECFSGASVKCICGMAIRAGKDLFMINLCSGASEIRYRLCEDKVLYGKIKRNGNTYIVYMPTGTELNLRINSIYQGFIEVDIHPALVDVEEADGLCGKLDNNKANDKQNRPGVAGDHNLSWKVKSNEDLFDENNYKTLHRWQETITLCECNGDPFRVVNGLGFLPAASCDKSMKKACSNINHKDVPNAMCHFRRRRDMNYHSKYDKHFDMETDNDNGDTEEYFQGLSKKYKRASYDQASARIACLDIMNTTLFQKCSALPGLDVTNAVDNCVADAIASGGMEWTVSHLEGIKKTCLHHVEVNQPIPPEVLAKVQLINYTDNHNGTIATSPAPLTTSTGASAHDIYTPKLLATLSEMSCPNECSGQGTCVQGKCVCNENQINFDCSISKNTPPQISGIPDRGKCDLQLRECKQTSILGRLFVESPSLTCKLVQHTANLESPVEVNCKLPAHRSSRSIGVVSGDDIMARYFKVSVSNDGSTFSSEDTVVIFDSKCVNCTKASGKVICNMQSGHCMKDGKCFTPNESYGCYTCFNDGLGKTTWRAGLDCPLTDPPEEKNGKRWLIITASTVSSVVIAGVCAAALVFYCKTKLSREDRKISSTGSIPNMQYNTKFRT